MVESSLPVCRVTYYERFGNSHVFLDGVAALRLGYLAEVPRNIHVSTMRSQRAGPPCRKLAS